MVGLFARVDPERCIRGLFDRALSVDKRVITSCHAQNLQHAFTNNNQVGNDFDHLPVRRPFIHLDFNEDMFNIMVGMLDCQPDRSLRGGMNKGHGRVGGQHPTVLFTPIDRMIVCRLLLNYSVLTVCHRATKPKFIKITVK